MKTDFQRNLGKVVALASLFVSISAFAGSESLTTDRLDAAGAHGRATLTVEDLKTLLGVDTRDPSSASRAGAQVARSNQDVSNGASKLLVKLSDQEKATMAKLIQQIEIQKAELVARVKNETDSKKAALRKSRQEIQHSRLAVGKDKDSALGKNLFESLLAEANLEAHASNSVVDFDVAHMIQLEFEERAEGRLVQNISFGGKTVWSDKTFSIAKQ